jgi:hypothetical protein
MIQKNDLSKLQIVVDLEKRKTPTSQPVILNEGKTPATIPIKVTPVKRK